MEGDNLAEKLSVPLCDGSRPINTDKVAVIRASLNNNSSLEPLARILTSLVLDRHVISSLDIWERTTASGELFSFSDMPLGICSVPGFSSLSPLRSGSEFTRLERYKVTQDTPINNLSR